METVYVEFPKYGHFITILFLCWLAGVFMGMAVQAALSYIRRVRSGKKK